MTRGGQRQILPPGTSMATLPSPVPPPPPPLPMRLGAAPVQQQQQTRAARCRGKAGGESAEVAATQYKEIRGEAQVWIC
ncbi:unnamed protein product [Calypogeia fissa]